MSEISDLEGPELYLALCRRRIAEWEEAPPRSRAEHEAAEAFTRTFAELDMALKAGAELPGGWLPAVPDGREPGIWPVRELLGGHSVRLEKSGSAGGETA